MLSIDRQTELVEARLPNGVTIGVEVVEGGGAGNVSALDQLDFQQVEGVIEGLALVVHRARPNRATAELGLDLVLEGRVGTERPPVQRAGSGLGAALAQTMVVHVMTVKRRIDWAEQRLLCSCAR